MGPEAQRCQLHGLSHHGYCVLCHWAALYGQEWLNLSMRFLWKGVGNNA